MKKILPTALTNKHLAVIEAIEQKKTISMKYDGFERIIEPYIIGDTARKGYVCVRGFQIKGESKSGKPTGWKSFYMNKASFPEVTKDSFLIRGDYSDKQKYFTKVHAKVS